MALAYRSIFTIMGDQAQTEEIIMEQFNEWLKKDPIREPRNLDRDLYKLNALTVFNPKTELIYFDHTTQDGSRTVRARLIENKDANGRWIATLTLHFSPRHPNETIVMYEGDAPMEKDPYGNVRPKWVGRPGLVRRILEVADARDIPSSNINLTTRPEVINDGDEVDRLYETLKSNDRTCSMVIVASKQNENPSAKIDLVADLMHESIGNVSVHILSFESTRYFNNLVGPDYAIYYDNMRVFLPDFNPDEYLNSRIHRIIRMSNVKRENKKQMSLSIGVITRKQLLDKPLRDLRRDIARIEQALNDREYEILLAGEKIIPAHKVVTQQIIVQEPLSDQVTEYLRSYDRMRNILGVETITDELLDDISSKLSMHSLLSDRVLAAAQTLKDMELDLFLIKDELDDAILIASEATEDKFKMRDQVRWLQKELSLTERAASAWQTFPDSEVSFSPVNFAELLDNLHKLPFIVFTGDRELTVDLDATELGARSGNAWSDLCGLNDYCLAKRDNLVNGGIMQYIDNLPNGYRAINRKNFRPTESESVERNPALKNQRLLKVPREVSNTGIVYMDSHINIGKRLHIHFFDDLANSGRIYVGRIGNHLDTATTN